MSLIKVLRGVATGAAPGVAAITVLPIFGAVGTVTATGVVVGSLLGALVGAFDEINHK